MILYSDHYFHTGLVHTTGGKPCQDYAISGGGDNLSFAVVSDGCSTGGHTDVGARLAGLSLVRAIKDHWNTNRKIDAEQTPKIIDFSQRIIINGIKQALGLRTEDMLATCAYAYLAPEGGYVHFRGDGALALGRYDGTISVFSWNWENNMPFYPAYAEDDFQTFIKAHGGDIKSPVLTEENCSFSPDKGFGDLLAVKYSLGEGIRGMVIPVARSALESTIEFIAIFSDGVKQVDGIGWKEAIVELLSFKSLAGEFAKRRMIRFIKDAQKSGKGPLDDISYAVIRIEKDMEE